jgi:hypothetical protein
MGTTIVRALNTPAPRRASRMVTYRATFVSFSFQRSR